MAMGGEEGVTVGVRAHDVGGADVAGGAGAVLDDDGLTPEGPEALRDDAGDGVGCAAGREGDDDPHRPARPDGLGPGRGDAEREGREAEVQASPSHGWSSPRHAATAASRSGAAPPRRKARAAASTS